MKNNPVSETNHGLVIQPDPNKLSIRIRPDGFSYTYAEPEGLKIRHLDFSKETFFEELDSLLGSPPWGELLFSETHVCVATEKSILIPAEADSPDQREIFLKTAGFELGEGECIIALPCAGGRLLLFIVEERIVSLLEKYFEKGVVFFHPFFVTLSDSGERGTVLQIDVVDGISHVTLFKEQQLLFSGLFSLDTDASLLLLVNRLIVSNKIGEFHIVCSGTRCNDVRQVLQRYYRHVSVHALGEERSLLSFLV